MSNKHEKEPLLLKGESGSFEKIAMVCDVLMLAILLWNQLYYKMDMLFLIIPLVLIGVYLVLFGVTAESYRFTADRLEILHPLRKTVSIPYDAVFNFDTTVHDSFINITQGNKIKLYYTVGKTKRLTICRPRDIMTFADMLKQNCPEFHTEEPKSNRLDVFFENKHNKE